MVDGKALYARKTPCPRCDFTDSAWIASIEDGCELRLTWPRLGRHRFGIHDLVGEHALKGRRAQDSLALSSYFAERYARPLKDGSDERRVSKSCAEPSGARTVPGLTGRGIVDMRA